jgi:hypothetical protein
MAKAFAHNIMGAKSLAALKIRTASCEGVSPHYLHFLLFSAGWWPGANVGSMPGPSVVFRGCMMDYRIGRTRREKSWSLQNTLGSSSR